MPQKPEGILHSLLARQDFDAKLPSPVLGEEAGVRANVFKSRVRVMQKALYFMRLGQENHQTQ